MPLYYLFVVSSFLAVALAVEGLYLAWNTHRGPEAQRISRRLRAVSAGDQGTMAAALLKQRVLSESPKMDQLLLQIPRVHILDRLLQQSGSEITVGLFLLISGLFVVIGAIASSFLGLGTLLSVPIALALGTMPLLRLLQMRRSRLHRMESQLPDVLDLISRAMRAGHSFPSGLEMVANESPEPSAGEFRTTFDEINFGISTQDALLNLAARVPSTDLGYFVVAVLIQRETGGNLAELLDKLSLLIRHRFQLQLKVRALSAEGRISAWILSIMPFAMAALLFLINPMFISLLWTDSAGLKLVTAGLSLVVIGIFWMWRVIKIRV